MPIVMGRSRLFGTLLASAVALSATVGCGRDDSSPPRSPTIVTPVDAGRTITLGDVDAVEPVKKIRRFQPLADFLSERLKDHGIERGEVVIARSIGEMGRFLEDGTVDVYFDSAFPALLAQDASGSQIILRRWKGGVAEYWSTYIALAGSGITSPEDFRGKIIAFEEPYSTSGFVLPAATLVKRGLDLTEVQGPGEQISTDEIGYFFSMDEENTIELLLRGEVAGGGISNEDYEELPADLKERIVAFGRTVSVPRQVVSVRPGLEPGLVARIRELLMGLDKSAEGRVLLEELKETMKFDPLPEATETSLMELKELMRRIADGSDARPE